MPEQTFEGLSLLVENNEPWVTDEELAKALDYRRVRDIRQLIERHLPFLPGIQTRGTVQRVARQGRGTVNIPAIQYILNESHALYISAKSNTLRANQLLQKVIASFIAAKKYILHLLTAPMEQVKQEIADLRAMYQADMARKEEELLAARSAPVSMTLTVPAPGQRTMVTVTNHVDTRSGKKFCQVQEMFGAPKSGKGSRLVMVIATEMGIINDERYMFITEVDTRGGDTFSRPSRKLKPIAIQMMAHTIIRRVREMGRTVPPAALLQYGDPDVPNANRVEYENGIPVLRSEHPGRYRARTDPSTVN